MRPCTPTYMIDEDDTVAVEVMASQRCHVRFGALCLVFDSAAEAEGALDEASLALRLQTVGRPR